MQHECQLEQPRLMSGCSWCEAAQAQRQRETAGYKAPPPPSLTAPGKAKELEVSETSPELAQEA